jgi:hypothetical protein
VNNPIGLFILKPEGLKDLINIISSRFGIPNKKLSIIKEGKVDKINSFEAGRVLYDLLGKRSFASLRMMGHNN